MTTGGKIALGLGIATALGAGGFFAYTLFIRPKKQFEDYKSMSLANGEETFEDVPADKEKLALAAFKKNLSAKERSEMLELVANRNDGNDAKRFILIKKWLGDID